MATLFDIGLIFFKRKKLMRMMGFVVDVELVRVVYCLVGVCCFTTTCFIIIAVRRILEIEFGGSW